MHKDVIGTTEFTFRLVTSEETLQKIYHLRYQVYCEECGFIDPHECPDGFEKDKYDAYSLHFVAEDSNGIIGTTRLILESPYGLPIERKCRDNLKFDIKILERSQIAEISRLAISKLYRRRRNDGMYYGRDYADTAAKEKRELIQRIRPMTFGLYREIYQECRRRGITHWFALMEKTLWALLNMHNFVFHPIGPEIDYYGLVRPYVCNIKELERMVSQKSPHFLEYFLDGLEPEYRPTLPKPGGADFDNIEDLFGS
jgi:N-acyl amino acid synthase of PEP-CTERM/exosortase system